MSIDALFIIMTLAVPTYILSKWIFQKMKLGSAKNRKYLAIIPTVILSPVLYAGIIIIWIASISYYPETDFNKLEWNENKEERYKMSSDIIKSEMLIGKTKEEVIIHLGNEFDSYSENHIAYYLGFVPGLFNIDPYVLDIYFENGKVIKVDQHET